MEKIKDLSLDQKAKLYYMGLVRKGEIDTLPEDPKAAFVRDMMDKEKPQKEDYKPSQTNSEVSEVDFIDDEGNHAKMQLQKATEYSAKLATMMGDIKQLPSWVQAKITKASDYMSSVYHYLDYETTGDQEDLTMETRPNWTPPPMGMGGEEKEDEEQEEYDKGWYGESLKETASKLGYLNEVDGMEGGEQTNQYKKASFVYAEGNGQFYALNLYTSEGQKQKLRYDEADAWLKNILEYIHEDDLIPRKYNSGMEDLDLIVDRLRELGIEASHNEYDFS